MAQVSWDTPYIRLQPRSTPQASRGCCASLRDRKRESPDACSPKLIRRSHCRERSPWPNIFSHAKAAHAKTAARGHKGSPRYDVCQFGHKFEALDSSAIPSQICEFASLSLFFLLFFFFSSCTSPRPPPRWLSRRGCLTRRMTEGSHFGSPEVLITAAAHERPAVRHITLAHAAWWRA